MPITKAMPKGDYCQEIRLFSGGVECPNLYYLQCRKYDNKLTWNISGRIHKCKECIEEIDNEHRKEKE